MKTASEINFDTLVGQTHNYAGLSYGNLASMRYKLHFSNPRAAAIQGLKKMKLLMELGVPQGILLPHERPSLEYLRKLGFIGTEAQILQKTIKEAPLLLALCASASSMWAANTATVTPSMDTVDEKVHFSIANLSNCFHRSIESQWAYRLFCQIFSDQHYFVVHPPLPSGGQFYDEGAANHNRFCRDYSQRGIHLFVFGQKAFDESNVISRYPMRQSFEASQAIIRRHGLPSSQCVIAKQNPQIIDKGVFHNDVISVGNKNVFFFHEHAFMESEKVIEELQKKYIQICGQELLLMRIQEKELSVEDAVTTYIFNSQIISAGSHENVLIAPIEAKSANPERFFEEIHYVDLHQSMKNGGGPACLRLRVVLNEEEKKAVNPKFFLNDDLYEKLVLWVEKNYRDRLEFKDLSDPSLLFEVYTALDELTQIFDIGSIYPFQRN